MGLGLLLVTAGAASANTVTIDSRIDFRDLSISPSAGMIQFLTPWTAQAFAQASNSLGQLDNAFDVSSGGNADADATVTFAQGHGDVSGIGRLGGATSGVHIPGCQDAQAQSVGRGTLFNSFVITGGTGAVDVGFAANVGGFQGLFTDTCGVRGESEIIFSLELDGAPLLFFQSRFLIGPDSAVTRSFTESLFGSRTLQYGTVYTIFAEADAESRGITSVPELSTIALVLTGLGGLTGRAIRRVV